MTSGRTLTKQATVLLCLFNSCWAKHQVPDHPPLTLEHRRLPQGNTGELTRHDMTMAPSARPPSKISSHPISCFPWLIRNWLMRPINQLCSSYSSSRPLSWIRCWQWGHRCHLLLGHCRQQVDSHWTSQVRRKHMSVGEGNTLTLLLSLKDTL